MRQSSRGNSQSGRGGNDNISGGRGNDRIFGRGGNDELNGGSGRDLLDGGSGNDTLNGGGGRDTLIGGRGRDTFVIRGRDIIPDFASNEVIRVEGQTLNAEQAQAALDTATQRGNNTIVNFGNGNVVTLRNFNTSDLTLSNFGIEAATPAPEQTVEIFGSTFELSTFTNPTPTGRRRSRSGFLDFATDISEGTNGDDRLLVEDAVTVEALGGNDIVIGRDNNNFREVIFGQDGNDLIDGRGGNDSLFGGNGRDTLVGGTGNDVLNGGAGRDTFVILGRDSIADFSSNETIGVQGQTLSSGQAQAALDSAVQDGNNTIVDFGDGNVVTLRNFNASDLTLSNFGVDTAAPATPIVQPEPVDPADPVVQPGLEIPLVSDFDLSTFSTATPTGRSRPRSGFLDFGTDISEGTNGGDRLLAQSGETVEALGGNDIVIGRDTNGSAREFIFGQGGNDLIFGQGGNDNLFGGNGVDTLLGGGGNDVITGGAGDDILSGGQGRDTFSLEGNDVIVDFESGDSLRALRVVQASGITFDAALNLETATQALGIAEQVGNDTIIDFSQVDNASPLNGTVTLRNFAASDLTIDNFSLG